METKTKEFIWSVQLSKEKKIAKWGGRDDGALEQIILKMAVLGAGAQKNERNLVQVTSFDSEQNKVNTCICSLTLGSKENQQLSDLSLFPPVNFTLIEGSGPVHIVANHIMYDDEDDELSDEDDLSEEEEIDLRQKLQAKLGKAKGDAVEVFKKAGQQKGKKPSADEESDDDDDDFDMEDDFEDDDEDDDDEEEEEEEPMKKGNGKAQVKSQKQKPTQKKTPIPVELDDDEEDEDDEEEEEAEAPAKKRKLTNGKSAQAAAKQLTSPERTQKKPEQKTLKTPNNQGLPKTPKSEKKTPAKIQYTSMDQIKAAIQKYPGGKPRKEDKFCNWVKNTYKGAEASWIAELWKWHKKEIGL